MVYSSWRCREVRMKECQEALGGTPVLSLFSPFDTVQDSNPRDGAALRQGRRSHAILPNEDKSFTDMPRGLFP